ncbi:hypothetical protein GGR50DRAFT_109392 [Xylaria sp. CBS 124048]|nr:hypothetical protein GGR50DRAFT_109392 [Xylaria sp. CBS 124048]
MNMQFCTQGFASSYGFPQGPASTMTYTEPQYSLHPAYPSLQYMYGYQGHHRAPMMTDRGGLCDGKTESKPRLSKEEVEKLEKVFQENPKPSSSVKAQLADGLGLERPRINNWFQNRRAKAKQERKQEEYEARRAAEKSASEPTSPDDHPSPGTMDSLSELSPSHKLSRSSSAAFPQLCSPSQTTDTSMEDEVDDGDDEERERGNDEMEDANSLRAVCSSRAEIAGSFNSPVSVDFSHPHPHPHPHPHSHNTGGYLQTRSMSDFGVFTSSLGHSPNAASDHGLEIRHGLPLTERSLSSEAYSGSHHYPGIHGSTLPSSSTATLFFSPVSNDDGSVDPFDNSPSPHSRGMPTPTDSFRSPPPPADIASRRNIPRPAALQAASLRSRSFNMPKTGLEGSKRMDMTSPVSSMRRISSATGVGPGRITKCSSGPRSPFFGRTAEALLQYHNARSPVGSGSGTTPTFSSSAAPPTPMTPALFDQRHVREPAVLSASPGDGSFALGLGVTPHFVADIKEEHDLKTPPTTPGLMPDFGTNRYVGNAFGSGSSFNLTTEQQQQQQQSIMTPYFNSEFHGLSIHHHHVPTYVETNEGDPITPVYGNMMGSSSTMEQSHQPQPQHHHHHHQQQQPYNSGNVMANTQYDWDANESVVSSRSSPGYPNKSKQIQFTPNMTPQDYH